MSAVTVTGSPYAVLDGSVNFTVSWDDTIPVALYGFLVIDGVPLDTIFDTPSSSVVVAHAFDVAGVHSVVARIQGVGVFDSDPVSVDVKSWTAFTFVDQGDEATAGDYDLYVCHHGINTATLEANVPAASLKLAYIIATDMPRGASALYVALRAATTEADYFHTGGINDEAHRLAYDDTLWYLRPSASLGHRLATVLLTIDPYFDGAFADEMYADIPDHYWNDWQTATDIVGSRATWDVQWDALIAAFISDMKAGFGSSRALIANSAGATYAGIDGITIEASHIISMGPAAALALFLAQQVLWEASANQYGTNVLNVAWNYDLLVAGLVYQGTHGAPVELTAVDAGLRGVLGEGSLRSIAGTSGLRPTSGVAYLRPTVGAGAFRETVGSGDI